MLINYHIHAGYTIDAQGTVNEYCKKAAALGFSDICFTSHHEFPSIEDNSYHYALREGDWKNYFTEIAKARQKYPQLKIRQGVEIGYEPTYNKKMSAFLKKYDFDYVICSIHTINNTLISGLVRKQNSSGKNQVSLYKKYYTRLGDAISWGCFDCVGHFDGVRRFSPPIPLSEYKEEVEHCIRLIKEKDLCVELNTGGWIYPQKDYNPSPEILKMMHAAGIRKITIGSDCHTPNDFDLKIKEGMVLLKKIGFKEICTFEKRKAIFHKI
jgi:histidinol-phosphatase (PHP family)